MPGIIPLVAHAGLADCRPIALAALEAVLISRDYPADTPLVAEERRIDEVGLIRSGSARLVVYDRTGVEFHGETLRPGDFYGAILIFMPDSPMIAIHTTAPTSVYRLDGPVFLDLVAEHADLREFFYRMALERLMNAYRMLAFGASPDASAQPEIHAPRVLQKAVAYIHANFMHPLSLDEAASRSGMSKYHFCRVFKAKMNISFKTYVNRLRIETAKRFMQINHMNVSEACFAVGFNDLSYFARVFRSFEGITPSQFRRGQN